MGKPSRTLQPLPWYPWRPVQWQASRKVQRMTWAERGLYRELMDECWLKGSVPATSAGIAAMFEVDQNEVEQHLAAVLRCFDIQDDGTMTSPFIEGVRSEQDAYRIGQKEKALEREKQKRMDQSAGSSPEQLGAASCGLEQLAPVEKKRKEKESKGTPLPPRGGRRRSRHEIVLEFTPEAREVVNTLLPLWHKTQPKDGAKINQDVPLAGMRVQDLLQNPNLTPGILIEAAKLYLATPKQTYKAMQFFFGPGDQANPNPWRPYAMKVYTPAQSKPTPSPQALILDPA